MTAHSPSDVAGDGLAAWIDPKRTAVLAIDMQVDFASREGALGDAVDLSSVPAALKAAVKLVTAARRAGVAVVFVGLATDIRTDSAVWRERMRRMGGDAESDSGLCRAGTKGATFVGPTPEAGEAVVFKTRYSGFYDTNLDQVLRELHADTLVVCGLTTECCVDCTVRDGFHLDYHLFVATDACAAYEATLHEGALKSLEANCAILIDTDAAVSAWTETSNG